MKHTPGPWEAIKSIHSRQMSIKAGNGLVRVANVAVTNIDRDANCKLIAAAPDLLAALKDVIDWMPWHIRGSQKSIMRARAAIAKAEGRS